MKIGSDAPWFVRCRLHTEQVCIVCLRTIPGVSHSLKSDYVQFAAGRKGLFFFAWASSPVMEELTEVQQTVVPHAH